MIAQDQVGVGGVRGARRVGAPSSWNVMGRIIESFVFESEERR